MKISIDPRLPVSLGGTSATDASPAVIRDALASEWRQFTEILNDARELIAEAYEFGDTFCLEGMNVYLHTHGLGEYDNPEDDEPGEFIQPITLARHDPVPGRPAFILAQDLRTQREWMDRHVLAMADEACDNQHDGRMTVLLRMLNRFLALLEQPSYEKWLGQDR